MPRFINIAFVFIVMIAMALPGVATEAQRQESFEGFMRGIRANAVKGTVFYQRQDAQFGFEPGLKLEEGDFIKTSPDSFAELLLQPGNYLRAGGDTDVQLVCDEYEKMKLKLDRGTIILEILARETSYNWLEAHELIRVITPSAVVFITAPGIFRINAPAADRTELIARNGEAYINGQRVKKKRRAVSSRGNVSITEIDTKYEDPFDAWAHERADTLVKANKSLKRESPWAEKRKEGMETSVELPEEDDQNRSNSYVVSAKPGTVNFVEDGVEFSNDENEWEPLTDKSEIEDGDKLRTATNSFAELMLFPDMYFRLDSASEVLFAQLSNDAISINVLRGSAILDVARFDRKLLPQITIAGPTTSGVINDSGNYRIDANGDQITVRDGKLMTSGRSVGSCNRIAGAVVSHCNETADNFDRWSEHRGEGRWFGGREIMATAALLARLRRQRFRNTGFWFQQPGQTSYVFVPFTSEFFRSPYGGNYSTVLAPRRTLNRVDLSNRGRWRIPGPQIARPQP